VARGWYIPRFKALRFCFCEVFLVCHCLDQMRPNERFPTLFSRKPCLLKCLSCLNFLPMSPIRTYTHTTLDPLLIQTHRATLPLNNQCTLVLRINESQRQLVMSPFNNILPLDMTSHIAPSPHSTETNLVQVIHLSLPSSSSRSPKPNTPKLQRNPQFPLQRLFVFVPRQVKRAETRRARGEEFGFGAPSSSSSF
jgi:hypothetical protein